MRTGIGRVALVVGSLLAALLLAELVLRVLRPQAVGLNRMPAIYERDPTTGYRYRPHASGRFTRLFEFDHTVAIDGRGLRDEGRPRDPRERVIVALGDSFTAAMHVPIPASWPRRLEQDLRQRADPSLRVVNLGLDGTGPDVQLELLRNHLSDLRPELVILGFFANDRADVLRKRVFREVHAGYVLQYQTEEDARALRELAERLRGRRIRAWLFEHSFVVRLAVYLWSGDQNPYRTNVLSPAAVGGRQRLRRGPSLHRIFGDFLALAESRGFELLVVPVPPRANPRASLELLRDRVPLPGLRVVDVLGAMRQEVAAEGLRWQDLYWRRDLHFNATGNRIFAAALADALSGELASPGAAGGSGARGAASRSSKRNRRP